ncbi:DUF3368 domain-containing protein [Anaerolineales bacterium HSG24]|nr:DUF3368 domain-containing protein [Anaerolineales bacterium HSG24]
MYQKITSYQEIPSVKTEIEQLQRHGFWASDALIVSILRIAGEL